MLKPVPLDQELIAEGRVIHVSKTLGISEASLRDGEGTLLAHATCTCAILRKPAV
jgi:acyl-coenzyme A thioesterase PaaI-like protein